MALSPEFTPHDKSDHMYRVVNREDLVYQVAQQMRSAVEPEEFEVVLLQSAIRGLCAQGGALWRRNQAGVLDLIVKQESLGQEFSPPFSKEWQSARQAVVDSGEPRVSGFNPQQREVPSTESISDFDRLVALQPLAAESGSAVLLEVHSQNSPGDADLDESSSFLAMLSELHSEYWKHQKLKHLEEQSRLWKSFESFARKLQSLWDPHDVYAHIVDGGRDLCGFDRVTLLTGCGKRCRVRAVSCTEHHSRYSQTVQKMQTLCGLLTIANQELKYEGETEQRLAPELQAHLQDLLSVTDARILHAVPLRTSLIESDQDQASVVGVLVGENFRAGLDSTAASRLHGVAGQAAPAVVRAALWESLPGNWFLRGWVSVMGSPVQRRPVGRWLLFATLLVVSALVFLPAEFYVKSNGQLQPIAQHHVFAPMNATVSEIHFQEDQPIQYQQPLLTLVDPDLELKLEELRGEQARVETRLRTIQTLRSNVIRSSSNTSEDDELAAEANELRKQRDSLEVQWKILKRKEKQLSVLSPGSGEILTWNSQELLRSRPVTAGQLLLTIADVNGSWRIDVKIPEREIGHVRQALRENAGEIPIEFSLGSQVGETYEAVLREDQISRRAEIDPDFQHLFRAAVPLSSQAEFEPFSGAEVRVRIQCGSRALGFVIFHDLYEWFQRNILF